MPGQPGRLVCWFRNLLIGRSIESAPWLRRHGTISPRSPSTNPNLPGGPAHKLAENYYFTRDLRREVSKPILASTYKRLPSNSNDNISSAEVSYPQVLTPPTPGTGYHWNKAPGSHT